MTDQNEILAIIAAAIQSANIDAPGIGDGTVRDQAYRSNEDSGHQAKMVLQKLSAAGYEIRKKA